MVGWVKLDQPSNYGNSSSILLASCEPGLHGSSPLWLPRPFENNRRANAPGLHRHPIRSIPIGQASRPCISLFIRLHTYSQSVVNLVVNIGLPCLSLAHLRDLLPTHTLLTPTLVTLPHVTQHTFPSYLPSLLTFPSDLIQWLRMDADFLVPLVSYAYSRSTSFIFGEPGMTP